MTAADPDWVVRGRHVERLGSAKAAMRLSGSRPDPAETATGWEGKERLYAPRTRFDDFL